MVGEEEYVVVAVADKKVTNGVFFLGGERFHSFTAGSLRFVIGKLLTLDIACVGNGNHRFVLFDQIFQNDIVCRLLNGSSSFIAEFSSDFKKLVFEYFKELCLIGKDTLEVFAKLFLFCHFLKDLFNFKTCKTAEGHFYNCLTLGIGKGKSFDESLLCFALSTVGANDADHLVNIIDGNFIAFQNM